MEGKEICGVGKQKQKGKALVVLLLSMMIITCLRTAVGGRALLEEPAQPAVTS
ncbi:MAG: hypothetical protein GF308_07465 [Candidatus Heimdallarchaeota archaeon]|nr:hypothetical protein [Candidatus Heimdallarchaeota archaeon]